MANPGDVIPRFAKGGCRIALTTAIDDASENIDFIMAEIGIGALPKAKRTISNWGLAASGHIKPESTDTIVGPARPEFVIETPVTMYTAGLFITSFYQNADYTGATTYLYDMVPWSDPTAAFFMLVEGGIAGAHVWRANGCVVNSLQVSVPMVGDDGGRPTFRANLIGANASRLTAFGTSEAGVLTDTKPRKQSSDFVFQIGGVTKKFCAADLTYGNSAARSPNIGATPDAIHLGPATLGGSVSVLMTSAASDEYDALYDAHEAGTAITLYIGVADGFYINEQVTIGEPEEDESGNVMVAKFPIVQAVYANSGYPNSKVYSSLADGNFLAAWGIT